MYFINENQTLTVELRDIKGYEGLYAISADGKVYGYKRKKFLTQHPIGRGYLKVSLCKDGEMKNFLIHRLVAEAFLSNPNNLPQVNHINEDKSDNRVENLEWVSAKENDNYGTRNKRISKPIYCIELKKRYESLSEAAKDLDLDTGAISRVCQGKANHTHGYHFEYLEV